MTYMWQEERGNKFYRFQTDDPLVIKKMKARKKFILIGEDLNGNTKIFRADFPQPHNAKRTLKSLTKNKLKYDKKNDVFYA